MHGVAEPAEPSLEGQQRLADSHVGLQIGGVVRLPLYRGRRARERNDLFTEKEKTRQTETNPN